MLKSSTDLHNYCWQGDFIEYKKCIVGIFIASMWNSDKDTCNSWYSGQLSRDCTLSLVEITT